MTAKSTRWFYAFGKATANNFRMSFRRTTGTKVSSILVLDLVKERIAQAVGIRIPLAGSLVGGQCRRPKRIRGIVAVHRQVESVREEKLRPFPPGAELLDPTQQIVAVD